MLHFLGLYTPDASTADTPPTPEHMEQMHRFVAQATQAGWLVQTGPLMRSPNNAHIRLSDGDVTVTEGPATARRELGFALLRTTTKEEIIEKTKTFLHAAGGGEAELFEIMAPPSERTA